MEKTPAKFRKLPAHAATHRKYQKIAKVKGWSLTTATERVVDHFIESELATTQPARLPVTSPQ